jgi:hypothetical protein
MDKIQFRLEYCKDPNEIGSSWEIVTNDKKSHNLWETEAIIENKSFND